jgi:hypothetical protein
MRLFANLFLILFLADGGFSLVDELVSLLTPLEPFTPLRNFLAVFVITMAAAVYLSLGIDRRLPKRIFLPQIIFVFFVPLSTWLFPPLAAMRVYGLFAAAAQLLLGMLPLYYLRTGGARSLTMPPAQFAPPFFSLRNTLIFGTISLFVIPFTLALSGLSAADSFMAGHTSGFMHLRPDGELRMTERIYRRDAKTIRLAAMIHVGNRKYYQDLANSFTSGRTIILAEGVSDEGNVLRNSIDYEKVAGFLGLTSQREMRFGGRFIEPEELDAPRLPPEGAERLTGQTDVLRADVDAGEFRPPTILLLGAVGKHLQESPTLVKGFLALNKWGEKNITPEMYKIIMEDILHRRNMKVVSHLKKALDRYDTVVIPWGALHMKGIEAEVLKQGFKLQEERQRVSIDFGRILSRP